MKSEKKTATPIIARVIEAVTTAVDRVTGDRTSYPLLVHATAQRALQGFAIRAQVMFGQAAWIEINDQHQATWAGCWGKHHHFWLTTEYGELVDLTTSAAHRRPTHGKKARYAPPMLWSKEVPSFYRYLPQGVAQLELDNDRDRNWFKILSQEMAVKCRPSQIEKDPLFPDEALICGRQVLDDSKETFRFFDRALSVGGLPESPL